MIAALLLMRPERAAALAAGAARRRAAAGGAARTSGATPALLWPIVLVFFIGTFGYNFAIILSAYTKNVFQSGADIYGLLNTAMAAGSVVGALVAARRTDRDPVRAVRWPRPGSGWCWSLLGLTPWFMPFVVLLVRRRVHLRHVQHAGQRIGAAGQRRRTPRPGDEPVHAGLHGRHADRLADRRVRSPSSGARRSRWWSPAWCASWPRGGRAAGCPVGRDLRPPEPARRWPALGVGLRAALTAPH